MDISTIIFAVVALLNMMNNPDLRATELQKEQARFLIQKVEEVILNDKADRYVPRKPKIAPKEDLSSSDEQSPIIIDTYKSTCKSSVSSLCP